MADSGQDHIGPDAQDDERRPADESVHTYLSAEPWSRSIGELTQRASVRSGNSIAA